MANNGKFNILIPDHIKPPADVETEVFGGKVHILTPNGMNNAEVPQEMWAEADAILTYDRMTYRKDFLLQLRKCKVIVRAGIGYDNIDAVEAKKRGIVVCNVPDYCMSEVADHTMALLLALVRNITEYNKAVQKGAWPRKSSLSFRLDGKTFGIVGMGRIGWATARRAKAFGLKVLFFDPSVKSIAGCHKVKSLETLAKSCDIISLHTPLTELTRNMINADFFKRTRKGLMLLNSSRGGLIDLNALHDAMKNDTVSAAGLDALPVEPPSGADALTKDFLNDAEWLRGRLLITPHVSYYSHEALIELRRKAALEAKAVLDGKRPKNCVNDFYGKRAK